MKKTKQKGKKELGVSKQKDQKIIPITFHQILWYFITFSVLGLIIETLFGYATIHVLESRKGLIWGPFCPIYGIGATLLIILLDRYQNNNKKLFFFGALTGDIFEYIASYVMETIYKTRFWDYTYCTYHLNGRISLEFTIFWGILAILLIKLIKPIIDDIISKIPKNKKQILDTGMTVFLIIDVIASIWAIKVYRDRAENKYYKIERKEEESSRKKGIQQAKDYIENQVFSDEFMMQTFPNLRYMNKEGEECYIRDIIKGNLVAKEK